ncbi:hypothetical protein [Pseudodesulfovibrio piezophilus]|uniref:Uncharacterized protein n=1 Tax=Pseudodesulfovibrio piezophilus (strain DSM 21447 / JCM 15486 / C1TLV30) TaxID=1322246 RepID=M1WX91_PSEP2|nr:hypothetical protein [Pseudodesulfovibrio piezophilus]CCH49598.1 conserved protein of unknown function [Pseudodesulfovibrio piezophilus C1TLV30]
MLPLDVPLTPDPEYISFLTECRGSLASVHFSLYDPTIVDARQRLEHHGLKDVIAGLKALEGTPRYALMNTRLHAPDTYFSPHALRSTAEALSHLAGETGITGIIFADPYHLQALSDAHPEVAASLEAIPSINSMLDSAGRCFSMLSMIRTTHFLPPSRIILDRSLNRDLEHLGRISERLKGAYPDIQLQLIANEGCLPFCPYKPAHDAHIAMINENLCRDRTFAMNHYFGCIRRFITDPSLILASPFIRPEDAARYAGMVESLKICGRNKGTPFLKQTISAYLDGRFTGNLLLLLDAVGDLADQIVVENTRFPDDFLHRVSDCLKDCDACRHCSAIAKKVVTRVTPMLQTL